MASILEFVKSFLGSSRRARGSDMAIDRNTGIIRSEKEDIAIPDGYVHDFVLGRVSMDFDPHRLFETEFSSEKTSTYGWLLDTYRQTASWLRKHGIEQGDSVAFYSKSLIEFTPCVLATWRVGASCTFIRPEMIDNLEFRAAVGTPQIIFASKDRLSILVEAGFENIVVYRCAPEEVPVGGYSFEQILGEDCKALQDFEIVGDPSKVLAIVSFTGGTTGYPKPIQLTHRNVISAFALQANGESLTFGGELEELVHICPFPTVHLTGILYRVLPLLHNGRSILLDPPVLPRHVCEAIQTYHANAITTVPVALLSLIRYPDLQDFDLDSLKTCVVVGGPLLPLMQESIREKLGLSNLYQRLGISECCGAGMSSTKLPGSVGYLCANTSAKVISLKDSSPITEPGLVGELCIRGPQVMIGYHNLPEKNAVVFDEDGFLHTGDLVTFDNDFNFFYFDRVEEFLRHPSGRMFSAVELELTIVYENPTVSEVSVIRSVDGPRALVVPVAWPEDVEALSNDIITRTNAAINEDWKRLTGGVKLLKANEIPRSVLGKHLKRLMSDF